MEVLHILWQINKITKKMIKIQKNDSILDILDKISNSKDPQIILEFPFWHPVLHNYLSLKVLKNKAENKNLIIHTNDKTSRKIGKSLWIKYQNNVNEVNQNNSSKSDLQKNYTFIEYGLFEIKKFLWLVRWNIQQDKKVNSLRYYSNKHKTINKTILIVFLFSFICILLILIYIYYFAINKTIIEITPEINLQSKARNYTYEEYSESILDKSLSTWNTVDIIPINKSITLEKEISTSWMVQDNKNTASWKVTFYNLLEEESSLKSWTQLENKNWILFETKEVISIPAASRDEQWLLVPWERETTIYWKIRLLNWEYSWEQANIKSWTNLLIPKLGDLRTKIYAKAISDFTWGSNDFTKILTQDDIDNWISIIKESLKQEWIKSIKNELNNRNINNNVSMEILLADNVYKFSNEKIIIPDHIKVWDTIDNFVIQWSIDVKSFIFNKDSLISKLTWLINNTIVWDYEEIINIDEKSIRISHIISRNDLKKDAKWKYYYAQDLWNEIFTLKWTTEIEYYVSKNFRSRDNNYINTLKYEITWMPIEKAESILTNNRDINNVKITVQPFFFTTISNTPENIIFKVVK